MLHEQSCPEALGAMCECLLLGENGGQVQDLWAQERPPGHVHPPASSASPEEGF